MTVMYDNHTMMSVYLNNQEDLFFEEFFAMTRFLKLVRHEDGKWKALPNETDDLAPVSVKERTYAPIDPEQLLKALDTLLSKGGGIKSVEDVPRLASLMKKFSKKLVSRCVYCNVLQKSDLVILSEYLDKGGWETINTWLEFAKAADSPKFLIEMLQLCLLLPMTLERLKENNTAKLIKSLTKHEHNEVKSLSGELVTKWMTIIKDQKAQEAPTGDKKKKDKKRKAVPVKKEKENVKAPSPAKPVVEPPKSPVKLKGAKRPSTEKEAKKVECYEDVKIDPEPLMPVSKKLKPDRPKTAKVYQKKFRSTGLEEETPLPKKFSKKNSTVDKTAAVAAAKSVLKLNSVPHDRINERKLKPETLAAINENSASNKGIKLIPAKPRPAYVLHESASFMDALVSQPAAPVKRKKKVPLPNKSNSPTSPTMTPPKLQFYKDTLEMNDENMKKEENEKENSSDEKEDSPKKEDAPSEDVKKEVEDEPMEVTTEDGGHTPPNNESNDASNPSSITEESKDETETPSDPNQVRSILSHGRRRGKKKSVQWVEEENIKEIFYFEMDENERVNVLKTQNFGDLKTIDLKKEREAIELSKRQMGDKMEEMTRWWIAPILIDLPLSLVEYGSQSKEKEDEKIRQLTTLQEIYFTKEMIPDSPHEPDLEIVPPQEPKIIPLDEGNIICPPMNYSSFEPPVPAILPEVLSSLIMKSGLSIPPQMANNLPEQMPMDTSLRNQPIIDPMNQHNGPMQMATPYDPADPLPSMPPNSLLGPPPNALNIYGISSPPHMPEPVRNMAPQAEWRTLDMVQDQYYGGFPGPNNQNGNHNMMPMPEQAPGVNMRPRMMHENYRPPMHKGPPPRGMGGPRPRNIHRIPCRHFIAGGCRFGLKCSFLHPGVNGPPL